jgi:hypothetical protein
MNELNPPKTPMILNLPSYNKTYFGILGMLVDEYPEEQLAIVRYHKNDNLWKVREKGHCQKEQPIVQVHRSIIYDLTTKQPLMVSPIRRFEDFTMDFEGECEIEKEIIPSKECLHTKFWDGTMMNVFYIERLGWVLSSRSKLYATCKFISDRLFSELFKEACEKIGLDIERDLSKDRVYSYVLLHPEIRRVFPVESPTLKLVQTHSLSSPITSFASSTSSDDITLDWSVEMSYGDDLKKSLVDPVEIPEELNDTNVPYAKMINYGWRRVRITNGLYRKFNYYRGVFPKRETCLIEMMLREIGSTGQIIRKYKSFFPEDAGEVSRISSEITSMNASLHYLYIQRHIRKVIVHENLPHWCRRPIWDLHGIHLREKKSIHPEDVVNYIKSLKASQIGKMIHDYKKQGTTLITPLNSSETTPIPTTDNSKEEPKEEPKE